MDLDPVAVVAAAADSTAAIEAEILVAVLVLVTEIDEMVEGFLIETVAAIADD
jgi:hypothetical protein